METRKDDGAKLDPHNAKTPTDAGTIVLVGIVVIGMCIVADLFLRLPPALDAVVTSSRAAPQVVLGATADRPFHEVYRPTPEDEALDWPTF